VIQTTLTPRAARAIRPALRPAAGPGRPLFGECHLWLTPVRPRPEWRDLLDDEERERAGRRAGTPAASVFITSRAVQRLIGSIYLEVPPAEVVIDRDCPHCREPGGQAAQHGRPRFHGGGVDYSASHTADWLLVAVTGSGLIGADIESLAGAPDADALARAALTAAERQSYDQLPRSRRTAWLISRWTRKEAAMKLTGLGLKAPPNQVDVTGATARARVPGWPPATIHLSPAAAPHGHVATLATTVPVTSMRWIDLNAYGRRDLR